MKAIRLLLAMACAAPLLARGIDVEKIRLKGQQYIKDLKYFQESGLIAARATAIEMQIEGFEKSLTVYREAKPADRNAALKGVRDAYERFPAEFKEIAAILRSHAEAYRARYNEKSGEPYESTAVKEKSLAGAEVGKQDETRAQAAFNNQNYSYSARLYLQSIKAYYQIFELRKWPQLVALPAKVPAARRRGQQPSPLRSPAAPAYHAQ